VPYKDPYRQEAAVRRWFEGNPDRLRELWRRNNEKHAAAKRRRKKRKKIHRLISEADDFPDQCLWHFWNEDGGCKNEAKWGSKNRQWRSCDLHKLPTDWPLLKLNKPTKSGLPAESWW
jgi:hypothetical protein